MKVFGIYDEDLEYDSPIGYLFGYEKSHSYIIELVDGLDEWEAPLLFQSKVRGGMLTIGEEGSLMWVKERVIPSERQNIGLIMRNAKMREYNELSFLTLTDGRCAQDNCFVRRIDMDDIPETIRARREDNIVECFVSSDTTIICLLEDETVIKVELDKLLETNPDIEHVLKNENLLNTLKVGVGGYSISFNDSIKVYKWDLKKVGAVISINVSELKRLIKYLLVDTTTACDTLECSRQNLSYLCKTNKIEPIIKGQKEHFYTRGSLERIKNE